MSREHLAVVGVDERYCTIDCPDDSSHRKDQDTFVWRCHHGSLEIKFNKDGTPFMNGEDTFTALVHDRTLPLAVVDPRAPVRDYHYSVKVTLPTSQVCTLDPKLIIDDGFNFDAESALLTSSVEAVNKATQQAFIVFDKLAAGAAVPADPSRLFFPNGIELISVDVEVGPAKVIVKVAGPKAPSESAQADGGLGVEDSPK